MATSTTTLVLVGLAVAAVIGVGVAVAVSGSSSSTANGPQGYRILPACEGLEIQNQELAIKWAQGVGESAPPGNAWVYTVIKRLFGECLSKDLEAVLKKATPEQLIFAYLVGRAAIQGGVKAGRVTVEAAEIVIKQCVEQLVKFGVDVSGVPTTLND